MTPFEPLFFDNELFDNISLVEDAVNGREFQSCIFKSCDFAGADLSNNKFIDCTFELCNLAMVKLKNTFLNNAGFKGCKMLGVNFSECQNMLFSVWFDGCILDYSSFMAKKMLNTVFKKTSLKEVTFSQANLAGSVFDDCDLYDAVFNSTDVSKANFATAYNFIIDPEINNIRGATFSAHGVLGLLAKYQVKII